MAADSLDTSLDSAIVAWSRVDLSAERHVALDQQGLEIADNQEQTSQGREALKEVVRQFRAVPAEERPSKIGGVIRAFQAEVDALTRRQSSAETAFLSLYRSLDDAPDPLPVLRSAATEMRRLGEGAADADKLRQQLAEYDKEFTSLKNQDATIRRLQQQLRDVDHQGDAAVHEAVEAALSEREVQWKEEARAVAAEVQEREAAAAARLQRLEDDAREASRAREAAQEQLFEMRTIFEQAQEAASAEIDMMRAELERATASQLAAEKVAVRLQEQAAGGQAGGQADARTKAADAAAEAASSVQLVPHPHHAPSPRTLTSHPSPCTLHPRPHPHPHPTPTRNTQHPQPHPRPQPSPLSPHRSPARSALALSPHSSRSPSPYCNPQPSPFTLRCRWRAS